MNIVIPKSILGQTSTNIANVRLKCYIENIEIVTILYYV